MKKVLLTIAIIVSSFAASNAQINTGAVNSSTTHHLFGGYTPYNTAFKGSVDLQLYKTLIDCPDFLNQPVTTVIPTSTPGYDKIKTINKYFHIKYAFTDRTGKRQIGDIGYSCLSGTPDMGYIKIYIANHFEIKLSAVSFRGGPTAIARNDFQNIMRGHELNDIIFFID